MLLLFVTVYIVLGLLTLALACIKHGLPFKQIGLGSGVLACIGVIIFWPIAFYELLMNW